MELTYKRILLKISGEVLAGGKGMGIDYDTVLNICSAVKECVDMGVQVGLVVGGGNFWRGRSSGDMDRTRADHMGMLATVMNSLALADALEHLKVPVRVQTAIAMQQETATWAVQAAAYLQHQTSPCYPSSKEPTARQPQAVLPLQAQAFSNRFSYCILRTVLVLIYACVYKLIPSQNRQDKASVICFIRPNRI